MAITQDMTMRNRLTLEDVMKEANNCRKCKGRKRIDSSVGTKVACDECWGTGKRKKKEAEIVGQFILASEEEIKVNFTTIEVTVDKNEDGISNLTFKDISKVLNLGPNLIDPKVQKRSGRPKKVKE